MRTLEESFAKIYRKFKLNLYVRIMRSLDVDEDDALSEQEVLCMEIVKALGSPTVNEFASFAGLSAPNAAYRVNRLTKKGYINKARSDIDKREYHLEATAKYDEIYSDIFNYVYVVCGRMRERFTEEEVDEFARMLDIVAAELMNERDVLRQVASRRAEK